MIARGPVDLLRRFLADTSGVSAVEYVLIMSGISIAIIAAIDSLGEGLFGFYSKVEAGVTNGPN